jgi:hypothetical protein
VYHILSTGLAWVVWGLMACSLLLPPLLSLCSHLALTFLLPLSILVGSYVGVGEFDTNTKCFALLLIMTYWWLAHLLPSLGWRLLLLILAPPSSGHADGTAYCCKYTGHEFPRHSQCNGLFITYPTHNVIRWTLLCYLLQYEPAHPINAVVRNNLVPNNVNLQQTITRELSMNQILPTPLAITLEHYLSNEIFSQSILVMILRRWCAMLSQRAVGRWISPCCYDTEPIPYNPLPWCDMVGLSDSTVKAFIDNHDPSRIVDFHQLFIGDN